MNRAQASVVGSKPMATLAVVAAVVIVAIVVAGEFNLGFAWSLVATSLPVLLIISFERTRETYRDWKFWSGCDDAAVSDIKSDARYHAILAGAGLTLALVGSIWFYSRSNPWWIAGFITASIVCLLLGPVEDEPQGE